MSAINDLTGAKKIHERIIRISNEEKLNLTKLLSPAGYKTGTSYLDADCFHGTKADNLAFVVEGISKLDNLIYIESGIIKNLDKEIDELKNELKSLKGLKLKIKTMQIVEGKSLKEIADELRYSYDYIRETAADLKKENPTFTPQIS